MGRQHHPLRLRLRCGRRFHDMLRSLQVRDASSWLVASSLLNFYLYRIFLITLQQLCLFSCFTLTPHLVSSDAQCLATCGLHVRDEALIERTARNILLRALCAASRRRRTRAPHSGAKVRSAAGRAHLAANTAATCGRCRICSCCSRRSCSLSRRSLHKARRRGSVRRRF